MQTMTRVPVPMTIEEREGLRALAGLEMRDPREQARFLIREELNRRGLLPNANRAEVVEATSAAAN
jgi:hypothetical protein